MLAWRKEGDKLVFAGSLPMPMEAQTADFLIGRGARFARLGKLGSVRFVMEGSAFQQLRLQGARLWSEKYVRERERDLRLAWSELQRQRGEERS